MNLETILEGCSDEWLAAWIEDFAYDPGYSEYARQVLKREVERRWDGSQAEEVSD